MKSHNRGVGNPNAAPTTFGFEFQVIVGILLSLEYIDHLEYVTIEGEDQDIEIKLKGNDMIYCQAKSTGKLPSWQGFNSGWSNQLSSGLNSLFRDYLGMKGKNRIVKKFIYAVNYFFPLGTQGANKTGFGTNKYRRIYGNEIYDGKHMNKQTKTLIKKLEDFNKDKMVTYYQI